MWVHDGPDQRSTNTSDPIYFRWGQYVTYDSLYALLLPNYRGGPSHGKVCAGAIRGAMGVVDYDDVIAGRGQRRGNILGTC